MYSGLSEQWVKSLGLTASEFDFLFASINMKFWSNFVLRRHIFSVWLWECICMECGWCGSGGGSQLPPYKPYLHLSCKLFEHVMTRHIMDHAAQHNILYPLQHGFRSMLSCETQLKEFLHDLTSTLQGEQSCYSNHPRTHTVFLGRLTMRKIPPPPPPPPRPHCKPALIGLIGPLRLYCSQAFWSCSGVSQK